MKTFLPTSLFGTKNFLQSRLLDQGKGPYQDIKMSALLKGLRQVEEYQIESTLDMVRALGCDCTRAIELLKKNGFFGPPHVASDLNTN